MSSTRLLLQCVLLVLFASRCTCFLWWPFGYSSATTIKNEQKPDTNASKVREDLIIPFEYCNDLDPYSDFLFARLVQDLRFVTMLYIPSPGYEKCAANLVNFFDILCTPESTSGFTVEHFVRIAQQYRAKFKDNTELASAAKYDPKDNKVVRGSVDENDALELKKGFFGCNELVGKLVTMFKDYYKEKDKYKEDIGFKNKLRAAMTMLIKSCAPQVHQVKDQVKRTCVQNCILRVKGSKWDFWCGAFISGSVGIFVGLVSGYYWFKRGTPPNSTCFSPNETTVVPLNGLPISFKTMILIVLVIIMIALGLIWYQHKYHSTDKPTTNSKTKKNKDKRSKHTKRKKKIKKEDELLSSSASSRASEISSMKVYVLKKNAKSAKRKSPKKSASPALSVPSSAPTVMYAPSDYQNLFHLTKVKPKPKGTKRTIASYDNKVNKNRKLIVKALSPKPTASSGSNQQSTDNGLTSAILKVPSVIPSTLVSTIADKNNKKTKLKKQNNESITKRG